MKTLEHLKEAAYRAYYNISFSPEKRAESIISTYSEELDSDLEQIAEINPEYAPRYKEKYEQMLSHWLRSKSNCISSMITGPARFPVARAEKANRNEENRYKDFRDWRDKIFKSFEKQARKQAIEDAGGLLEIAKSKLEDLKVRHEYMKRINKAHAAYKKNPQTIIEADLLEEEKNFVIRWIPRFQYYNKPFMQFELTNNLAKIKNTEARVKELERKEESASGENKEIAFPGGKITLNFQEDRIQISNDEMPSREMIGAFKSHGLKWSPRNRCWQRQITANAKFSMKLLFKNHFQTEINL